ncbi:MAG: hypothetical protein KC418_13830 [Anaerolineales bacterium]|nr:hypothetical protein [Anaerolineales bacterium]
MIIQHENVAIPNVSDTDAMALVVALKVMGKFSHEVESFDEYLDKYANTVRVIRQAMYPDKGDS